MSLVFILFYVILVSAAQFPLVVYKANILPRYLPIGPWMSGLIFSIGLFVSVAIHEFGHVLVAQAQGITVKSVTLMMLGGVSEMGEVSNKPYAEFKLAAIGPLTSLILAVLLGGIWSLSISPEISLFCYWLGSANAVLALFNLLPAFPMDGGGALRSVLAVKMGKMKATRISVSVSRSLAWILGIVGLFSLNFLLMLIAFFIYSASGAEYFSLASRRF